MEYSRVGKRGAVVIPADIRRRHNIDEGATIIIEECAEGVLFRAAPVIPSALARQNFFEGLNAAVAVTRLDATAWSEEQADRERLDGTLADGLEDEEYPRADSHMTIAMTA
jgi:AbrB family looped-hinge helix DNA binding protein